MYSAVVLAMVPLDNKTFLIIEKERLSCEPDSLSFFIIYVLQSENLFIF